jgi:hypothetical protein
VTLDTYIQKTMDKHVVQEQIKVASGKLVSTVKAIIKEGNVRRIVVRNGEGRTLLDMPLTAGVLSGVMMPVITAIAGIVMLAKEFTVVVERHGDSIVKADDPS